MPDFGVSTHGRGGMIDKTLPSSRRTNKPRMQDPEISSPSREGALVIDEELERSSRCAWRSVESHIERWNQAHRRGVMPAGHSRKPLTRDEIYREMPPTLMVAVLGAVARRA